MTRNLSDAKARCGSALVVGVALMSWAAGATAQDGVVTVGGEGRNCIEDPQCINRLHPDIPMAARAEPGQTVVFHARNATDFDLDPASEYDDPRREGPMGSTVHPLTGPVLIQGAEPGDVLAVTIMDIDPGPFAFTSIIDIGFVSDRFSDSYRVLWRLGDDYAVSDDLPGVRIPNGSFPGIITTLPGRAQHEAILAREAQLLEAGGAVSPPEPINATPEAVCGPRGSGKEECLRTFPPREHGGNLDTRHMGVGATIYLPCFVEGCGLAIGDLHYAQGDGEVAGTAIEMDATVTLTTQLIKGGRDLPRGPHYEGAADLLNIPSERFYATTGFPWKVEGDVPPDMEYLESAKIGKLSNLSKDISLAARNALLEMIDYIAETYGLTCEQAYVVASVAVDLRISQLVDAPNVGVVAILPLDIFLEEERNGN